ncbi:MAG TPA: methyltransferase domain-containing protein [Acidisphaera sp.]|nr:methyltransferase domain-containing protein [Acidisphaera sp.]
MAALLGSYPRARPALSEAHQRIYIEEYRRNRGAYGGALFRVTAALESWMHRRIAQRQTGDRLLELGAGTLNHLRYEPALQYDIVEPLPALYEHVADFDRVAKAYVSIADIPEQTRYSRIISVAVLEHVEDLPRVVAHSGLLLDRNGIFQAGIPAEGGLLWGLAWRMTTGIAYRLRTGLSYAPLMHYEHVNTAAEIIAIIRYCFAAVTVSWFPLPHRHLSFYCYIEARNPDTDRCKRLLTATAGASPGMRLAAAAGS